MRLPSLVSAGLLGMSLMAAPASAQTSSTTPALLRVAERLSTALPDEGTVRVAVLPFAERGLPGATRIRADVSDDLSQAFSAISTPRRRIDVIARADVDRAALELGLAQPLSAATAPLVGVSVYATYVVVGTVAPGAGGVSQLYAEVIEVARRRRVASAATDVIVAASSAALIPVRGPAVAVSPGSLRGPSANRKIFINTGLAASLGALAVMGIKERELRRARSTLLNVPVGAQDQWNREFEHAEQVQNARNLWRTAAIGAGGATLAYMLLTRGSGPRQNQGGLISFGRDWSLTLNPSAPGLLVAGGF
jgi:hypothetical protein